MADEIKTSVQQETYFVQGDGSRGKMRLNVRGEQVVVPLELQLVMDGRVFNASNAVQETDEQIVETARGSNNVNPSLLLDVPSGVTVLPFEVIIDFGDTPATSKDMVFTINTDDGTRFVSGGAKITPVNMRKDDPRTSKCPFYSASTQIVASNNVDDDMIFCTMVEEEATPRTVVSGAPLFYWTSKLYVPPYLVGPASFLIYLKADTTNDQEMNWSVKWAEFDTAEAIRT